MELPEGFACPISLSMGPILVGREQVISGRLANRFNWESIWNEHKIIGGVVGPICLRRMAI